MARIGRQTIVVGIDGSTNSDAALEWAVAEASARGLALHVVSAGVYHGEAPLGLHDDAAIEAEVAREALDAADARVATATAGPWPRLRASSSPARAASSEPPTPSSRCRRGPTPSSSGAADTAPWWGPFWAPSRRGS